MPAPRTLDPAIATVLAQAPTILGELTAGSLPALRSQRLAATGQIELSDAVERVDHTVPGPDGGPDVVVRVHTPKDRQPGQTLPCVYSIHGGGYVLGTYEMEDLRFDRWCPQLGVIGVAVEYRLAPETPYPGPLDDCYAGLDWVFQNADRLGVDRSRIGISGASAGGGLAAALGLLVRDRGEMDLAFQMLIYPMVDDRQRTPSSQWEVPIWNPANNTFGWKSYLGSRHGTADIPPYAAPARATDLSGLPPTFVCVGTMDGFCDEDIEYAQRLNQAGVLTELHVYPGAPHGFDGFAPDTPLARRSRRDMREWLASVIGAPGRVAVPAG
jgi:acetyl esterase/lipase